MPFYRDGGVSEPRGNRTGEGFDECRALAATYKYIFSKLEVFFGPEICVRTQKDQEIYYEEPNETRL